MTVTEPHRDQVEAPEPEPLSAHQAAELTERIRAALHTGHELVVAAWRGRAHEALGYTGAEGWSRYCSEEFTEARALRIDAETRREIVAGMRAGGMSTRAIASGLGVSQSTAAADAAATDQNWSDGLPATVTSLDGRRRPAKRLQAPEPTPAMPTQVPGPARRRRPLRDGARDLAYDLGKVTGRVRRLTDDDRLARNRDEVAACMRTHLVAAIEALQSLDDSINHRAGPGEPAHDHHEGDPR